jgi:hypothetical protein
MYKAIVILTNTFNLLDVLTTHIGVNVMNCVETNQLVLNPIVLYVVKPLVILAWSLVLWKLSTHRSRLISKTSKILLVFLAGFFISAVVNNTLVIAGVLKC